MCGLLLVEARSGISQHRLQSALRYLKHRGPEGLRVWQSGNITAVHSVLNISGDGKYYQQVPDRDFCAFAGEIYNYRQWRSDSDAALMHDTVRNRIGTLKQFQGPSSWIYATPDFVCYATDPQGERHLYRYQDQDIVVVASEVATILHLIDVKPYSVPYDNKAWTMLTDTPWQGIQRLDSGRLYINHEPAHHIDSLLNWVKPVQYPSLKAATEEFKLLWQLVMQQLKSEHAATISFSGGVDSGLISALLPEADLLALDMIGKDPNIPKLHQVIDDVTRLTTLSVGPELYAGAYRDMIAHTRMPAQSWSHVGKWLVAKHAGHRVIYSGAGADELFGGYSIYKTISYPDSGSASPYSQHHDTRLWQQCIDACANDARSATLLMDYLHQVVGCDSQGLDRAAGAWGREIRNPFMHPSIIKFALSLPWELRVAEVTKPVLKQAWHHWFPGKELWPKQGFAGHANDSLPWMGIDFTPTEHRHRDWQSICQQSYRKIIDDRAASQCQ